jgi:putative membrane protein
MTSDLAAPRRLHRAEIILAAIDNLRDLAIALVIGLVVGTRQNGFSSALALVIGLGGVAMVLVIGYLRWSTTVYWVDGGAVHLRSGLISPDETSVPLGRIQALDTTQGPVQRLFGVHELHVQTAGGGSKGEIVLRAVSEREARELRAAAGLPDPVARELPEWRLGAGGLFAAALTTPQLGVLLPLVGGAFAAFDDLVFGDEGRALFDRLPHGAGGIALLILGVAAATLLASFLGAVVAFSGFTLVRDGDRLRIRRGLVQRRAASIPLARVHAVHVVESLARRPFGLAAVRIETAGYRSEAAAAQTLLPLVRRSDLPALLEEFVPALAGERGPLERPPARSRRRYALPPALAGALAGGALTAVWSAAWPAVPAVAALGALYGLLEHAVAGYRLEARRVVIRRGAVAHRTLVARADRLQEHELISSLLQRRAGLADLALEVGSGRTGRVRHLDRPVAEDLFNRLR